MLPPRLAGFGGKGIRTPDFQLAKLALYQLSYAPARMAECRMATCDFKKKKMPDVDLAIRHPAFFLVDVQQRLNCALSVVSLSLDFFRCRGLHGMSKWMIN